MTLITDFGTETVIVSESELISDIDSERDFMLDSESEAATKSEPGSITDFELRKVTNYVVPAYTWQFDFAHKLATTKWSNFNLLN